MTESIGAPEPVQPRFSSEEIARTSESAKQLIRKLTELYLPGVDVFQPTTIVDTGRSPYHVDEISCVVWINERPYCVYIKRLDGEDRDPENHTILAIGELPPGTVNKTDSSEDLKPKAGLIKVLGLAASRQGRNSIGTFIDIRDKGTNTFEIPSAEKGTTCEDVRGLMTNIEALDAKEFQGLTAFSGDFNSLRQ